MKKYLLITIIEREMISPDIYDNYDDVYEEMKKRMDKMISRKYDEYDEGEYYGYGELDGIINRGWIDDIQGQNYDFYIEPITA